MNFSYFIAKNVARVGEKSFSRTIIRVAIFAVALSVAVMIVSTSVINGFKNQIRNKIFGFWGHIHITEADLDRSLLQLYPVDRDQTFYPYLDTVKQVRYRAFEQMNGFDRRIEKASKGGIKHIQVFTLMPGIIQTDEVIEGIILKGIDRDFDWSFMEEFIVDGVQIPMKDTISRGILISKQTADRLDVGVGDNFIVNFVLDHQIQRKFNITGIYKTGLEEYDRNFALVDIAQLQQLLGWRRDQVSGFEVFVENLQDLDVIDEYIYYEQLPNNLRSETIDRKYPEIFEWLALQDINEVVILTLMVVVAIINMMTALLILILERTNMIGTLKALGSNNWSIQKIFLLYAGYIIIIGLFWGNFIGLGLCYLQEQFEIIKLSEENYYLSVAPVEVDFWPVLFINLGTLLITLVFLVLPSYLVTTINPVKAIRFK